MGRGGVQPGNEASTLRMAVGNKVLVGIGSPPDAHGGSRAMRMGRSFPISPRSFIACVQRRRHRHPAGPAATGRVWVRALPGGHRACQGRGDFPGKANAVCVCVCVLCVSVCACMLCVCACAWVCSCLHPTPRTRACSHASCGCSPMLCACGSQAPMLCALGPSSSGAARSRSQWPSPPATRPGTSPSPPPPQVIEDPPTRAPFANTSHLGGSGYARCAVNAGWPCPETIR